MKPASIAKILLAVSSVALGLLLIYALDGYDWFIRTMYVDPLWASVIVTIVLVGINAYYAWQTRQTIMEMEKARKAEFMPRIKARLDFLGPVFLLLKLESIGKGPAMNINASITFSPSNETRVWEQSVLSPNESIRVFLPDGNIKKVCEKSATINVKGKYSDVFRQSFEISEEIDVEEFLRTVKQLNQLVEPDVPRLIQGIKDEIAKIRKKM